MKTFSFQGMVQFDSEHGLPTICGDQVEWLDTFETKGFFYKRAEAKAWKYYFSKYPEYKEFIQLA